MGRPAENPAVGKREPKAANPPIRASYLSSGVAHLTQGSRKSHTPRGFSRSQYLHHISAITEVSTSTPVRKHPGQYFNA